MRSARSEQAQRAERTRRRLESVPELPSLPSVLGRLWELAARQDTSARDLARILGQDPGLTAAVLRLANSAYFGFPCKIGTVTQAIVVLGFETVKGLALSASVFRVLKPASPGELEPGAFHQHALAAAMGARLLAQRRAPGSGSVVFSAGILHDLGKLVAAAFLTDAQAEFARRVGAGGASYEETEREVFGLTHAEMGAWFADRWEFPPELSAAVRWHHRPEAGGDYALCVAAVHAGDVLAHRAGAGGSARPRPPELSKSALGVLGVSEEELVRLGRTVQEGVSEASWIGLPLGA